MNELMAGKTPVGAPFALPDGRGRLRKLEEFRGRLVLLYFGYTQCPDVCPTDLVAIGSALKILGPQAEGIQPVFITLDPARDTPQVLREYAPAFHPSFVALRGTEAETLRIARSYKVFYEKVPDGKGGYAIDHAAVTFLLDREGNLLYEMFDQDWHLVLAAYNGGQGNLDRGVMYPETRHYVDRVLELRGIYRKAYPSELGQ